MSKETKTEEPQSTVAPKPSAGPQALQEIKPIPGETARVGAFAGIGGGTARMKLAINIVAAIMLVAIGAFQTYHAAFAAGLVAEMNKGRESTGWVISPLGQFGGLAGVACVLAAGLLLIRPQAGRVLGICSALAIAGTTGWLLFDSKLTAGDKPPTMVYVVVGAMVAVAVALFYEYRKEAIFDERAGDTHLTDPSSHDLAEPSRSSPVQSETASQPTSSGAEPLGPWAVRAYARYCELEENAAVTQAQGETPIVSMVLLHDAANITPLGSSDGRVQFKCPWCATQYVAKTARMNLIFRCLTCKKQVLAEITKRVHR